VNNQQNEGNLGRKSSPQGSQMMTLKASVRVFQLAPVPAKNHRLDLMDLKVAMDLMMDLTTDPVRVLITIRIRTQNQDLVLRPGLMPVLAHLALIQRQTTRILRDIRLMKTKEFDEASVKKCDNEIDSENKSSLRSRIRWASWNISNCIYNPK
jgi:hypothetical protein